MRRTMHGRGAAVGAALLGLGLGGCANFWEDITSRDIPFSQRCKEVFVKPDPFVVLRDSQDGDRRAAALRRLKEPAQNKGTEQEQKLVMEILSKTAVSDPQPLCRLIAIEKLGNFKDPGAAKALEAAFYGVDTIPAQFANLTTRIQCQALTAMGKTGNPDVVPLLAQVLREPPAERSDEAQHRDDRCIAAARALGHFNDAQATEALLRVLSNKKEDLALRDSAHTSLVQATGRNLPNEPEAWEEFLHPHDGKALAKEKSGFLNLATWFKKDNATPKPEIRPAVNRPTGLPPANDGSPSPSTPTPPTGTPAPAAPAPSDVPPANP